jgi:hypothetical protein
MKEIEYLGVDVGENSLGVSLLVKGMETYDTGFSIYTVFYVHEILSPLSQGSWTGQVLIVFLNQ